jgi:DNA invertase Pin-like site-specific DNA recombinase
MYKQNKDDGNYKIGIYIRLSREDGDNLESESIINQRSFINAFLDENNLAALDEYIDDGYSGCNFNRPDFQRLLKDIQTKKINMIITKDLSRLGRDHVMTGYYIESFFPKNNIRYIAINDDVDTFYETSGSEMMPFKLSMNDMYAKDISKKVRSHLLQMKLDGKFCGSVPPYGYMRNPNNKHQLVIEPQTALVVKRIFNLYISGYSSSSIAELLTKEKVSTPIMVKNREKSLLKYDYYYIWKSSSINNILKNRCYIGELIQHKSQNINYKVKKRKKVPKNEWCIIENAHEAIISKDIFDIVQSLRNKKNNYNINRRNVEYILSDLVYCKDCGAKMSISYDKKRDRISMNCNNYRKYSKYDICSSHFINYNILKRMIFNKISLLSSIYINNIDEFKKIILNKYSNPTTELNKKINFLKIENEKIKCKQDSLYDDKFNNIISLETYERLFKKYENDININNDKILNYELELSKISSNSNIYDDYTNIIEDYLYMKNPTKETLNKLIEKIYITKDKKIEIHYRIKQSEVLV